MAQQPAVLFIARHGLRLDVADANWHLSSPAPYDPPLTYGGWNQSRALGTRIASLLHERGQSLAEEQREQDGGERPRKRRRTKHKVIIHTSPFLRCLQTSIAIAAGIAQYKPPAEAGNQKRPSSASPRLRTADHASSPRALPSIPEPRFDFAHAIAQKALQDHTRYRKSQLRVDAFLGEWLNVQYFEGITAPPPSAMMLATAKAELWEDESVEFFRPSTSTRPSANGNLWAGGARPGSRESPLADSSPVEESLSVPASPVRSRANSQDSHVGSESGRKSPFRPGSPLQPLTSTLPKQEPSLYKPPVPHYAVGTTHQIPRGYVTHAREACADVDYSWDSSRAPQSWGDGGVLGEEWSELHRRFRKGLNCLVEWYSQFRSDDEVDSTPAFGPNHDSEDEHEDLVVVLVTHSAGCNALIGALTAQPVLLDVGMASLSMAVRRDDAPALTASRFSRRGSMDTGLSSVYDMKIVASTDHLRPGGADVRRTGSLFGRSRKVDNSYRDSLPLFQEPSRPARNAALGSIRRPSAAPRALGRTDSTDSKTSLTSGGEEGATARVSSGLWTPPGRTSVVQPQAQYLQLTEARSGEKSGETSDPNNDKMEVDPKESNKIPPTDAKSVEESAMQEDVPPLQMANVAGQSIPLTPDENARRPSQAGLWGGNASGAHVQRRFREPKRRWTVEQDS